ARLAVVGPDFVATPGFVEDFFWNGNGDGVASPGEQVRVTFRIRNSGLLAASHVRPTAASADPRVTQIGTMGSVDEWIPGDVRTVGVVMSISPTAESGDVVSVITLTADSGGPWRFILTFPIVAPAILFSRDDTTVTDPVPTGDGDGIVEPGERLFVNVVLRNDGTDAATNARVSLAVVDSHVTILAGEATHAEWPAGETRETGFVIDIDGEFTAPDLSLVFHVDADAWGPWQFSHVVPVIVPAPEFVLAKAWVFDPAPDGNRDGRAAPGERVLSRVRMKNVAAADARNVEVTMTVDDPDVTVVGGRVVHDTWPAGEARNNGGPVLEIAPSATPHDFTATVLVTADEGGPWEFDVPFTIAAPHIGFGVARVWVFDPRPGGNRDGMASPGERVLPRVRVWNEGRDDAFGVSVVLTSADPDVTVVAGEMTYERWDSGSAVNSTGFVVDIAGNAHPHDAPMSVTVTTARGGSWVLPVAIPITYRAVEFVRRSSWVFDPQPGGDRDGQAEAGERVEPRLRLLHVGSEEARNVRISLTTDDADVTVTQGDHFYETWAPGTARNAGVTLHVAPDAAVHDVMLRARIRAGNGGPWDMTFTLPIAGPAVGFVFLGPTRDTVEVTGTGAPGARLRHIGSDPLQNVRVTLASGDPDVTVLTAQQVHATWLPGETRASEAIVIRAASDVDPHAARLVLSVTTEEGGLWQFEFTVALNRSADFEYLPRGGGVRNDPPGGNGDKFRGPGETVVPYLKFTNRSLARSRNVVVALATDDPDVAVVDGVDTVDIWLRGRTMVLSDFSLVIADDATAHEVTVNVTLTADHGDPLHYALVFDIGTAPALLAFRNAWVWDPEPGANRDGQVNPGERVFPRVRIRNVGEDAARNIHTVLSIADDDVAVVNGIVTHDEWPGGEARNNNGFVIDIAPDAAPHAVQAVFSVTADNAGARQFTVTIPIVAPEVVAETALLANYPNPFNPETWIPFDLSEAADVTVSMYDARGVVVRRLDLGRLAPGVYRRRSTAAYWDGRNDFGERVSSGMYMYELRAGAARHMRRMIVRK
ncbi:hypothetical protein HN766_19975, partial [Candidatus Poribacteria bacterium]|nr:hypothetical protein [Candidatus Poribacteria bacterium]